MRVQRLPDTQRVLLRDSLLIEGDATRAVETLPAGCVQCVVTSPPYWGMRDYGVTNQIGCESTLEEYLAHLVTLFSEIKRVLRDDGILWINIGDGYTSGKRTYRAPDPKNKDRGLSWRPQTPSGLKSKELLGIPWRIAFALQSAGWYLRTDIIWSKPNTMPESVKDRPCRSHEYLFMLSKNANYYYDYEGSLEVGRVGMRNRRTVWTIPTQHGQVDHSAVFPGELIEPCIVASTKPKDFVLDPFFGSGTVGLVCQKLKRRFVGIELNPSYVKYAADRLGYVSKSIVKIAA